MTSFGYRLNPRYAIKECSSCRTLYTRDCSCSKGSVEDKILVPKPPKNCARCAKCGHPVNGPYCQRCALLREKLKEDLVSYFQNFQNTSESSDDSTNVVNAPREPFVVKNDHVVNPPHIDKCCCECGEALDGIFCQQCICKSCGKGAHTGYNCPPKVPINSNPEPCNQTMNNELPQTLPSFDSTCYSNKENSELAEYINTPGWNRPAFYNNDDDDDDDVDYTIAITPVLSTEEPDNSLIMEDEHLDTIPATESDKVIKSSVEDLVPIPSESEGKQVETTSPSDFHSSDYEISSGSTTTRSDISLLEYDSFIFDLPNDQFPPADRSDFTHEEFTDELTHIIAPPEPFTITKVFPYGTVELSQANGPNFKVNGHRVKHYFGGDVPQLVVPDLQTSPRINKFEELDQAILRNLKILAKGFYPPSLNFLSFNWES
nr:reverse transcriptase domain-containing protein [Tanacetum cinerariifolium]